MVLLTLWLVGLPFRILDWLLGLTVWFIRWTVSFLPFGTYSVFLKETANEFRELRNRKSHVKSMMRELVFEHPTHSGSQALGLNWVSDYRKKVRDLEEQAVAVGFKPWMLYILFYDLNGVI